MKNKLTCILGFLLAVGVAGCDTGGEEEIETALMPAGTVLEEPLVVPAKPEDDRSMDEILTEEMAQRRARRGVPENMSPVTGVVPPSTVTNNNSGCNHAQAGISTSKCHTPKPKKLSSKEKKKLFDRINADRKNKKDMAVKYTKLGFPIGESWKRPKQ